MATILVLDDVFDAGILIKKILERQGHNVHSFTEENAAIAFSAKNAPDLAILDIQLKQMNGLEVAECLQKKTPDIKIIILTGYPTRETVHRACDLNISEYCIKPIDKRELEEKVATVLDRK